MYRRAQMNIVKKFFAEDPKREVQNKELTQFAVGVMGQNFTYNLISGWFMYFCTDVLHIEAWAIGLFLGLARVWDAINDPIVGTIVDRHRFKNGEKLRPYLITMAIPVGICAMLMFIDIGLEPKYSLIYICAIYLLWDLFYSFQDIAQWGMTAMIATTSDERGKAAQFARIGGMVGGWLPGLLSLAVANLPQFGVTEKTIFAVAGVVMGLGGMLISMYTHKAKERAPVKPPEGSLKDSFKLLFSNKIAMALVIASVLSNITFYVQDVYFFKYMVTLNLFGKEVNGLNIQFIYGILVGLPGTLAVFVATWFARKLGGMKNLILTATILNIVTHVIAFFVGYTGWRIVLMGALMALSGIPNSMLGIATTTLWGDSIDYMEWKTGKRNEGSVFALQNLVAKLNTGLQTIFAGLTLTLLSFDSTAYEKGLPQSDAFYKWIWPVYILGPAIGSAFYLIPILMLKYDEKQKHVIEAELHKRRAESEANSADLCTEVEGLDLPIY